MRGMPYADRDALVDRLDRISLAANGFHLRRQGREDATAVILDAFAAGAAAALDGATVEWGYRDKTDEPIERWPQLPEAALRRLLAYSSNAGHYELLCRYVTPGQVADG